MTAPVSRTGATDREVEAAAEAAWTTGLGLGSRMPWAEIREHTRDVYRRLAVAALVAARAAAAPDSGQREHLARHLADHYGEHPVRDLEPWRADADAILALLAEQPGGGR